MAGTWIPALLLIGSVEVGADRIFQPPYFEWIQGKRVALVSNQTGVDRHLRHLAELMEEHPGVELAAILAPEHGFEGALQAGHEFQSTARIHSLYGEARSPTPAMLEGVEVLLYDIQDVGARFYTYISTLAECLKAAKRQGIPLIVLDRPAPLNGIDMEGPLLREGSQSFVGVHTIPVRYAMTPGELARMLNQEMEIGADLRVVPLKGWRRRYWQDQASLVWIPPSPNMPTLETATVYPGFCLLEGTNLSEGRGTTRPFELFGAPWLDGRRLALVLNDLRLPGVRFRAQSFRPAFSKYEGEDCQGVQVHVLDREVFRSVETALHVLAQTRRLHPRHFEFIPTRFDRLAGEPRLRKDLEAGLDIQEIVGRWKADIARFWSGRQPFLLYP